MSVFLLPVCLQWYFLFTIADKQQELDVPTLKVEDTERPGIKETPSKEKNRPMCQISGVRKLKHTNSFTGVVPKYGVETPHKEELGKVSFQRLKINIII